MNCGHPIRERQEVAQRTPPAAPVPPSLADKMRAAPVTGERKPVTAVFADVVGSTALAETMDPEDWIGIMNRAFELMSRALYQYEGTIASLIGDGLLGFFGAPVAHEDDPERAVLASLAMLDAIAELRTYLAATKGIDFEIRVGVNTGEVVVGSVGSDLRYEYTALGDTMNVAARVEAAARPASVLVTSDTHRFISSTFHTQDHGEISVKGKSSPVHVYEVVGRKAVPDRIRGLPGVRNAFVGRDTELAELTRLFDAVTVGRGSVAVISGEPGIGKSRLIAECKGITMANEPRIRWAQGQCLSYGRNLPHHLLVDLVRSLVGSAPAGSEEEGRVALHSRAAALLGPEANEIVPYLEHLLSFEQDSPTAHRLDNLDPAGLQTHYVSSLRRYLAAEATDAPVILTCEDVHWADPSSVEVLQQVMAVGPTHPVLWILTLRPGSSQEADALVAAARTIFGEAAHELVLEPLSRDDSRRLLANLLEIELLPEQVRDLIHEKSDGNPFFVEEVIRVLIERGALERRNGSWTATSAIDDIQIPDNLHGLLLARIDALPEKARHTLLVASVIGRQFAARVLERVLQSAGGR